MPRLSTLSNPTGLIEIDKSRVVLSIDEHSADKPAFSLLQLDLDGLGLPGPLDVVVVARRGNFEERVELGPAPGWDKSYVGLHEIGKEGTWNFRILLKEEGSSKLVATAENVRPFADGESESFIALEPAELGERPWEIEILDPLGQAVLRFNKNIYRSVGEAAADKAFMCLVLPEALRQLAQRICDIDCLEDQVWHHFRDWLHVHGVSELPEDDDEAKASWCNEVVEKFCNRFKFSSTLQAMRLNMEDE